MDILLLAILIGLVLLSLGFINFIGRLLIGGLMAVIYWIGGSIAVVLFIYLLAALLKPELFS